MTSSTGSSDHLAALQRSIGYQFIDLGLLQQAVTHKSHSKTNNERLEFVGDAVLGYLVGSMLYRNYPHVQEDALSLMRAQLVRGKTLAQVAMRLNLPEYLQLGSGESRSGGRQRASILADALEAVIGAVHEDGGIEQAQQLVQKLFADLTQGLDAESLKDPKTRLQELLQGNGLDLPTYTVEQVSGADHQRQYTVKCEVPSLAVQAVAADSSRRAAEKAAAHEVLILALAQQHAFNSQKEKKAKKKAKSQVKMLASIDEKPAHQDTASVQHQAPTQTRTDPILADGSDEGRL
jgi:ribonuclease-3